MREGLHNAVINAHSGLYEVFAIACNGGCVDFETALTDDVDIFGVETLDTVVYFFESVASVGNVVTENQFVVVAENSHLACGRARVDT